MIAYLLLTYGARQGSTISHPAARTQLISIKRFCRDSGFQVSGWHHDYCRKWRNLGDLPILRHLLHEIPRDQEDAIILNDLGLLFRRCQEDRRHDLLKALMPRAHMLFGVRQGANLANLSGPERHRVRLGVGPARYHYGAPTRLRGRTHEERVQQTKAASIASAERRGMLADARAAVIAKVRDDLAATSEKVTLQQIADEANRRGMRTSRDTPWTLPAVSRALKRADDRARED